MFGDLMGMMGKLKETQDRMEKAKADLKLFEVSEVAADGALQVVVTGAGSIKNISISEDLLADKEIVEDLLVVTLNKALAVAKTHESKVLEEVAKVDMLMLPGMDQLFK